MDGGLLIGREAPTGNELTAQDALKRLDALDVGHALAASFRALWFDAREGNRDTLAACAASNKRLHPMAVINLLGYDDDDGYLERLKRDGHAATLLWSGLLGWDLSHASFRALIRRSIKIGLPMQIVVDSHADLVTAADAAGGSDLPVMIRWSKRGGYNNLPNIIAVAGDCPNFLFDVATITQSGGIERLAERIGSNRLFIASNMPLAYEHCGYFLLQAATLSVENRRLIGGGNLARLFGTAEPAAAPEPFSWAKFRDWPKTDTHWHTSGWNIIEPRTSIESLQKELTAFSYQRVISSSIRALNDDLEAGNTETRDFMDRDPRVRGLIVINPLEPENSIAQLDKWRTDPRFVGVKTIQDFYGLDLDAPGYFKIFDHVAGLDRYSVMAHLPGMRNAAERYPTLNFVAAHSTWRHHELVDMPNAWFDIATSTYLRTETDIGDLIAAVGADRVIYSSDGQLMNPAWTLGKLAGLDLDDDALDAIFRRTVLRAFPRLVDDATEGTTA